MVDKECKKLDLSKIKIKKLGEGNLSASYKVERGDYKWIFKFIPTEEIKEKFYINRKPYNFKDSCDCEYEILSSLKKSKYTSKVCFYQKNIKLTNNKYKKKFKDIYKKFEEIQKFSIENHSNIQKNNKIKSFNLLVLKYLKGETLEDYMNIFYLKHKNNLKDVFNMYDDVCFKFFKMMKDIYEILPSFFHGDLHLKNVLINRKKELKIIDFGLSCNFTTNNPIINSTLFSWKDEIIEVILDSNNNYKISKDILKIIRCSDFEMFFEFLIFDILDKNILYPKNLKFIKNKFFKSILEDLNNYTISLNGTVENIQTLYMKFKYINLYYNIIQNRISSSVYKKCLELDFI